MWDEGKTSGELCEVARAGDVERVAMLLSCGAQANAADYDNRTCLHLAASQGHVECVRFLVGLPGIALDTKDRNGVTPLQDAIHEGHRDVERILRQAGASR